jgi:hypothetical protein
MADVLIELATRALNAVVGAAAGYVLCFHWRAWTLFGLGTEMSLLVSTVAGAARRSHLGKGALAER